MDIPQAQAPAQTSSAFGGPSVPPELYSFLNDKFNAFTTSIQQMSESFDLKVQRLENTMNAQFIKQKEASDHATQRFNRLIGTLADASIELKEHQETLEKVLEGILANSQTSLFNSQEAVTQISKTRLSFALLVDDLESMKNLYAHIDSEMSALKKELKNINKHGPGSSSSSVQPSSVDLSAIEYTMSDNSQRLEEIVHTRLSTMQKQLNSNLHAMESKLNGVDTRPSQVDTRGSSQRTLSTGLYSRSTPDAVVSTLEGFPRRPILRIVYRVSTLDQVSRRALVCESSHSLCGLSRRAQFGVVVLQVFLESSCSRVFGVVVLLCELYSSRYIPPQVWSQSCNEPLCTSLLTACNMRNMPQQPDEPLMVLRNSEIALYQLVEHVSPLTSSIVGEVLTVKDIQEPLPSDMIQLLPLKVSLPLNSPPLMGCSLELVHRQSNLVLLSALHGLERALQLMCPALCLIWIILTGEHQRPETQEPLKESSVVLRICHPLPPGPGTPSTRPLLMLWLLHLWLYMLLRHRWGRYQRLTTCCYLPGLPRSLVHGPEELLGHVEPIFVLLRLRLVLLLLLPACRCCYCCTLRLCH
ncbi:hypothetical protein Taro_008333 [Colocasia esculenta]|uniref:Uncharacterized protein n=1 Tax=Colocasia esculenta TaxID=4460 RepID=A0A843U6N0_COLES|nr:hypothetical protein [Colocasia esculenta]